MKLFKVIMCAWLALMCVSQAAGTEVVDVSPKQVAAMLKSKSAPQVIDVRTSDEYKKGHIKGAVVIDVTKSDFAAQLGKLDKEKTYIIHCRSGGRSGKALKTFKKLGFSKIYHMDDGMNGWKKAGMSTESKKPE
jgi:rhodanese-related sulfurtransferase